jgi:hypothetical protein
MATIDDVAARINETADMATRSLEAEASAGYEALDLQIRELEAQAREAFQAKLGDHFWPVVEKLEDGAPLAAAEQDMLQLFMIGDAQYYVKYENDVENWKNEVKRLVEEIRRLQASGLTELDSLMHVRTLCREAMRILPDLAFYFREKEHVRKFEEAIRGAIDRDTRRLLANLIKEMLASDKV